MTFIGNKDKSKNFIYRQTYPIQVMFQIASKHREDIHLEMIKRIILLANTNFAIFKSAPPSAKGMSSSVSAWSDTLWQI